MFPRVLLLFGVAGMATSQGYETPTGAFALESTVTSTVYTGVASSVDNFPYFLEALIN